LKVSNGNAEHFARGSGVMRAIGPRSWVGERSPILGETPAIQRVREQVRRVSAYDHVAVMVVGETGTGKELVAQEIHRLGAPERSPFVAINCAAIPESLFESELFGHESGAYTGARAMRRGLIEDAADGTLFLDEVGEMPMPLQAKLLRALETRTFRRVGSNAIVPVRARIVSATNRLGSSLRADLLYRLAGFTIALPPLRERAEDVPLLATAFLGAFAERHENSALALEPAALERLAREAWPGNARELRSLVERLAIVAPEPLIRAGDVELALASAFRQPVASVRPAPAKEARRESVGPTAGVDPQLRPRGLRDLERDLILKAFGESSKNLTRAAKQLGIPRSTLRDKLRRYGAV
jgi:DNA-binding NtrC family response regulator